MISKLEEIREKLNKALDMYPSDSEIVMRLSKELDKLIIKSYIKSARTWSIREK